MKRKNKSESSGDQLNDSEGISFDTSLLSTSHSMDTIAGKIELLQMINFMCHSSLGLKFNSRVNFITGRNGSGKSAIMAALIVVLGGSASLTNRGSGITDFIKKGETWARVTITLINEGINAFRKDIYGSRVIISRNISISGNHSYVCKSENGQVVSRKKEEVDNIVTAFNLQIKNPICVLNQDVARSFLCATDNSLRFSMFMKATQLEQLKTLYVKTLELLVLSKKHFSVKEKGIEEASAEISQLKDKLELLASLERHVHERTGLENEYFWALVADEEKKIKALNQGRDKILETKKEYVEEEANIENLIRDLEKEVENCQTKLEEVRTEMSQKAGEKVEIQREVQNFEKQIEKAEVNLKIVVNKIDRQLADINGVKEHLHRNDSAASQSEVEKEQANEKIGALRQKLSDIREEVTNGQRELNRAEEAMYHMAKSVENMKTDMGEMEQNKRRLEILVAETKARGQNNYLKFGPHTQELIQAIDNATRKNYFQKRPVGPCGLHVTLTGDPKWARAVESVIGGLMLTYRCDNQKVLSKIMERICGNRQPPIIIGRFLKSRHDVESKKVSFRGFHSVLDVLSFDSDIVFNTFIDQARIETILLFESDQQAASILTNIQNVPKNLRMGLTVQSDQYFPAPNYRTYYGDSRKFLKYFDSVSKGAEAVKRLESELKDTVRLIQEKDTEIVKAREESKDSQAAVHRWKLKLKKLKQEEGRIQVELKHLKDIEETRPVTITKLALEEELEDLERRRKNSEEEASKWKSVLEELKGKREEAAKKLSSLTVAENEMRNTMKNWEERLEERKYSHRKFLTNRKGTYDKFKELNKNLKKVEEEIQKSRVELEKKVRSAEEICPDRMATERSPVEVQKLLEKCEKYLKAAEKITGSREATIVEYKTKSEFFKQMKKMAALLESAVETLTYAALKKENKLNILQSHTSNLVSFYFQAMLQTRGYDGQLKIDFENKVLDIEVRPKDATVARKDSKTLSGGERSYSMVSFILAVWKVVQMPVYFLDEFDVFMDKVNRKVIMDLLMEHANVQSNKQFVFITPLDISGIQTSEVVSVYRLPDPERRVN